jgi:hypothetical protein
MGNGAGNSADSAMYAVNQLPGTNELSSAPPTAVLAPLNSRGVLNEGGQIDWPLGLRILAPEEEGGVRQQIETLFNVAASQTDSGDARVAEELGKALEKLRKLLVRDKERMGLPMAVNRESELFVKKLKAALKSDRGG